MSNKTSSVKFTPQQEAAIKYRSGALLVSAAAGSGKTKVLVERLLGRIDEGDDIDEFLVITYTRAASFELKERIYEEIQSRLAVSPGNMRLRRQSLLCKGASIGTIHTFCAEILRDNAHLVGLPPDFRVADENESRVLKTEVLETLIDSKYESINKDHGFAFLLKTVSQGRDDKNLTETVMDIYHKLQSLPYPQAWIDAQIAKLGLDGITDISETDCGAYLLSKTYSTVSYCKKEMSELREEMRQYADFEQSYAESVEETIKQIDSLLSALKLGWDEAVEHRVIAFPRAKPIKEYGELKEIRSRCNKILKKCAIELEIRSDEHISDMRQLAPAITTLLRLIADFGNAYMEKKHQSGVADFSDLEHLTLSLLVNKTTGERTEIARMIAKRYKEIMIDEYQDVNAVQEIIFTAISDKQSNIFMVGDVKQSIYRFRLADPLIFLSKYAKYPEYADVAVNKKVADGTQIINAAKIVEGTKIHLVNNFRSRAGILEAVNHIFGNIMSVEFGDLDYTEKERLVAGRNDEEAKQGMQGIQGTRGAREVQWTRGAQEVNEAEGLEGRSSLTSNIGRADTSGDNAYAYNRIDNCVDIDIIDMSRLETDDQEESPAAIAVEAEYIAKRIKELTDGEHMISGENGAMRPAKYSDVVILLRSMKGRAWQYANALSSVGIQAEFVGSEGYFESIEISSVISLLSVIDNPMQDIRLAALMCGPIYRFTSDELVEIRTSTNTKDYYDAVKEMAEREIGSDEIRCKCRRMLSDIEAMRAVSSDMSADRLIWHIYSKTRLEGIVSSLPDGRKRRNNLVTLAEAARRFEKNGYKGLFGFLSYIENLQDRGLDIAEAWQSEAIDSVDSDAVKVMSIHKSKGLEFPIVFIANTSKQFNFRDIRKGVVFHNHFGVGAMITDSVRRIKYTTLARTAIQSKLKDEMLSEELRVLYVAMTRAREKLIITAALKDAISTSEKLSALPKGKIAPQAMSALGSMIEWILAGLADYIGDEIKINSILSDPEPEKKGSKAVRANQILQVKQVTQTEQVKPTEQAAQFKQTTQTEQPSHKKQILLPERALPFEYEYPHNFATEIPSKLTVTGLKSLADPESEIAEWMQGETVLTQQTSPSFITVKRKTTAAERGTVLHHVMQHIDYKKWSEEHELRKELQVLIKRGVLEEAQANELDLSKILSLFSSEIGSRMLDGNNIKREFKFSILRPAKKYFQDGGDDDILIQGVVDCFFEENGEIVIVDFKTDNVNEKTIGARARQYAPQLEAYADALEGITGKRVKERIVYFMAMSKAVTV